MISAETFVRLTAKHGGETFVREVGISPEFSFEQVWSAAHATSGGIDPELIHTDGHLWSHARRLQKAEQEVHAWVTTKNVGEVARRQRLERALAREELNQVHDVAVDAEADRLEAAQAKVDAEQAAEYAEWLAFIAHDEWDDYVPEVFEDPEDDPHRDCEQCNGR